MTESEPRPTPTAKNRRRAIRRSPRRATKITCLKGVMGLGPNLALQLLDVAECGVRLVVKQEILKGQEVELTLQGMGHPRPLKLNAEVVWCVPTAEKTYCIGARFRKNLSYADLQQLT